MMSPFQSEPCFANLFTLLSATQMLTNGKPNGTAAFVTSSRLAQPVADVSQDEQPALYIMQGEIDFGPDVGQSTDVYHAAAIVYFTIPGGGVPASPVMNGLRDALIYQMRNNTLDGSGNVIPMTYGEKQQLGGTCYSCAFDGKALANEGLQNNQGAAVFPITILTGI